MAKYFLSDRQGSLMLVDIGIGLCWYPLGDLDINAGRMLPERPVSLINVYGHRSWSLSVCSRAHN